MLKNAKVQQRSNVHTVQQILGVICAPVFFGKYFFVSYSKVLSKAGNVSFFINLSFLSA